MKLVLSFSYGKARIKLKRKAGEDFVKLQYFGLAILEKETLYSICSFYFKFVSNFVFYAKQLCILQVMRGGSLVKLLSIFLIFCALAIE